jgi:hypothetical protein
MKTDAQTCRWFRAVQRKFRREWQDPITSGVTGVTRNEDIVPNPVRLRPDVLHPLLPEAHKVYHGIPHAARCSIPDALALANSAGRADRRTRCQERTEPLALVETVTAEMCNA